MPKSKSSVNLCIAFPEKLLEAIKKHAAETGETVPFVVREACIYHLGLRGQDVSGVANPRGRGKRSDIAPDFHHSTCDWATDEIAEMIRKKFEDLDLGKPIPESVRRPSKHKKTQSNEN